LIVKVFEKVFLNVKKLKNNDNQMDHPASFINAGTYSKMSMLGLKTIIIV